jgi:hypothetical protein
MPTHGRRLGTLDLQPPKSSAATPQWSATIRYRTGKARVVCGPTECFREITGQRHRSFIDGKVIGIPGGETLFINEHLMLPFRLDMVPNLRD